ARVRNDWSGGCRSFILTRFPRCWSSRWRRVTGRTWTGWPAPWARRVKSSVMTRGSQENETSGRATGRGEERAEEAPPRAPTPTPPAAESSRIETARRYRERGELLMAVEELQVARRATPDDADVLIELGATLGAAGRSTE